MLEPGIQEVWDVQNDAEVLALHDKATRGFTLSPEERVRLDTWYASQDEEEGSRLASTQRKPDSCLQEKVLDLTAQLASSVQRIGAIEAQNDALRREISGLQQRLTQKSKAQPA